MAIKLPSKPKLALYGVLTIAAVIATTWFFSERDAPTLNSFEISPQSVSISKEGLFSFAGSIADSRGVTEAQFECVEDGDAKLIIFIAMQGNDRNRVSFGRISGTANWSGRWSGTAYEFDFEGLAQLSSSFEPTACNWHARLGDIIGNRSYFDTGVKLELAN